MSNLSSRATQLHDEFRRVDALSARTDNRYLVKRWIDRGAFSVTYGESNVGKTFFALDLGLHIAAGKDWHGQRVAGGRVVYIAAEGGGGIANRIAAISEENPELVQNADLHILPVSLDLCANGDAAAIVEAVGCLGASPALIIIDTLSRVMGAGDENTAKDMGQLVRNIDFIRAKLRCHVMIVHHSGKDASKGARGSSSLRAAVDTEIELTRSGNVIIAETRKQRDMTSGQVFAYVLEDVQIGTDEDGDPVTSAIVVPTEAPSKRHKLTANQMTLWEALQEYVADHGKPNPGGTGWPEAGRYSVVEIEAFKVFAKGRFTNSNPWQAVARALKSLQESGRIGANDSQIWPIGAH
jgi:hypothetical protein